MSGSSHVFCVDTSALIDGLERYYPEVTFPALWKHIAQLVEDGRRWSAHHPRRGLDRGTS